LGGRLTPNEEGPRKTKKNSGAPDGVEGGKMGFKEGKCKRVKKKKRVRPH